MPTNQPWKNGGESPPKGSPDTGPAPMREVRERARPRTFAPFAISREPPKVYRTAKYAKQPDRIFAPFGASGNPDISS
jgi:hypothetical protein